MCKRLELISSRGSCDSGCGLKGMLESWAGGKALSDDITLSRIQEIQVSTNYVTVGVVRLATFSPTRWNLQ